MELDENVMNFLLIGVAALFLFSNVFMRKKRNDNTPMGKAVSLLLDIRHNQKLTETFTFHRNIRKFRTSTWEKNKEKLDFLPRELMILLEKTFTMAQDVNDRIEAGKRFGSDSYMAGIDLDKMKKPIIESEQAMQQWVDENMQNPDFMPKRSMFG